MNKIFKSLVFPAISLLLVTIIYGGLSIESLNIQTKALQKQNQDIAFNASNLENKLNQIQTEVDQANSLNSNLSLNLVSAQKQIAALQAGSGNKISSSIIAQPAVITKTVTQTIDRPIILDQATVTIENVGSYKVDLQAGDNAFKVLQRAASQNNFTLKYDTYSFGVFITSIGNITPKGNQYWAFYFNGAFSQVGASDQPVAKGDSIFWQLASF